MQIAFFDKLLEILLSCFVDDIRIKVGLRREVNFRLVHMEEGVRIALRHYSGFLCV